ncbi:MarR family winged helix-turn-helix transcriptional regulator [Actinoplanes sp. L3-i22]|uniref:MarR family winged helix-turn-helix transcriptional regulator n=1 Tax=Actinoplanes sp. L3-i22 TaxID=2836373 RepID=UPI001C78E733|nr:MarR family transcriptional regulator [Actinoplanes sp. L3-i22]BCY12564.1 hypothetical protein L3i22_076520 [Actinoplanes sp. L3-i22]
MGDDERYAAGLDRIIELVVLLNDDMTKSLAAQGLSVSRMTLLWALREMGPSPQRALADALKVTPRAITGLVDGLVAGGLVTREAHPTDRRAALVTCTARGTELLAGITAQQREFGRQLFAHMPAARFDALLAGLDDVLATLHGLGLVHQPGVTS